MELVPTSPEVNDLGNGDTHLMRFALPEDFASGSENTYALVYTGKLGKEEDSVVGLIRPLSFPLVYRTQESFSYDVATKSKLTYSGPYPRHPFQSPTEENLPSFLGSQGFFHHNPRGRFKSV
jgi:hypothetical protein